MNNKKRKYNAENKLDPGVNFSAIYKLYCCPWKTDLYIKNFRLYKQVLNRGISLTK